MNLIIILVIAVIAYFIFIAPNNNKQVNVIPITPAPVKAATTLAPVKVDTTLAPVKVNATFAPNRQQQRMPNTNRR